MKAGQVGCQLGLTLGREVLTESAAQSTSDCVINESSSFATQTKEVARAVDCFTYSLGIVFGIEAAR